MLLYYINYGAIMLEQEKSRAIKLKKGVKKKNLEREKGYVVRSLGPKTYFHGRKLLITDVAVKSVTAVSRAWGWKTCKTKKLIGKGTGLGPA